MGLVYKLLYKDMENVAQLATWVLHSGIQSLKYPFTGQLPHWKSSRIEELNACFFSIFSIGALSFLKRILKPSYLIVTPGALSPLLPSELENANTVFRIGDITFTSGPFSYKHKLELETSKLSGQWRRHVSAGCYEPEVSFSPRGEQLEGLLKILYGRPHIFILQGAACIFAVLLSSGVIFGGQVHFPCGQNRNSNVKGVLIRIIISSVNVKVVTCLITSVEK